MYNNSMEYQLEKESWDEYIEDLQELEQQTLIHTLNKSYNRKGFTLSDYNSSSDLY